MRDIEMTVPMSGHTYPAARNMSSNYHLTMLCVFFTSIVVVTTVKLITPPPPIDDRITERSTQMEIEKIDLRRQHLQRNADVCFYGAVGLLASLSVSVLIVASGLHRAKVKQASVHLYKIAESEIRVHERDLSLAAPIALGLMNAEQLRQMNGGMEKAFELSCRMAEVQHRHLSALIRGHTPELPANLPEAVQTSTAIPTFRELLQRGVIGRHSPLIFGFGAQMRTGTWHDIYSNATGGQSGSGKTNTLLCVIGQSVLQDIRFWIVDYHWPHEESLLAKLGPLRESACITYAHKPIDVRPLLEEVNACIDRRLRQEEPSHPIRVLCIDEVLRIVKVCGYTEQMIERIGTEGRKVNVLGVFSAQSWKADKVDTTARDNLTSIFAHYMKPNQAKPLLQDSDKARVLKSLHKGQMLFCPVMGEPEVLTVPYVAPDDLRRVAELVNAQPVDAPVDAPVDQAVDSTGLVEVNAVDLIDQVKSRLKNPGDFTDMVESTGLDKAYVSRILNRKQPMSKNAEALFKTWVTRGCASPYHV